MRKGGTGVSSTRVSMIPVEYGCHQNPRYRSISSCATNSAMPWLIQEFPCCAPNVTWMGGGGGGDDDDGTAAAAVIVAAAPREGRGEGVREGTMLRVDD
jgi:hypothetical protein